MRGKISYLFALLMMSIIISMAPATTASETTLAAPTIIDEAAAPGAAIDIPITVSDVVDLYGFTFKLRFKPETVTLIGYTIGDFLPDYFEWKWYVGADYGWLVITRRLGAAGGITGSGLLATLHFTVNVEGVSCLDLYDTALSDSSGQPIAHTVIDGGYSSTADIRVNLITAFVEDRRWHLDADPPGYVTLSGRIKNKGSGTTQAFVRFSIFLDGDRVDVIDTATVAIAPGEIRLLSADFYAAPWVPAEFSVEAQIFYIGTSGLMVPGTKAGGTRETMIVGFFALP